MRRLVSGSGHQSAQMCAEESEKDREEDGGGSSASFIYLTAALTIQPQNFLYFSPSPLKLILLNPTRFFISIFIFIFFLRKNPNTYFNACFISVLRQQRLKLHPPEKKINKNEKKKKQKTPQLINNRAEGKTDANKKPKTEVCAVVCGAPPVPSGGQHGCTAPVFLRGQRRGRGAIPAPLPGSGAPRRQEKKKGIKK